jgi:hypothetical protein
MVANAEVGGNFTVDGGLTVLGASLLQALTINGSFGVTGSVIVNMNVGTQTLTVTGAATVGSLIVSANSTGVAASITNANAGGTGLVVQAASSSNSALLIKDYLGNNLFQVRGNGDVIGLGGLTISGATTLLGSLDVKTALLSNLQTGVTVNNTPVTIYTAALVHGANVGGLVLVTGTKVGDATIQFTDWVCVLSSLTANLVTGITTSGGAGRVYSWSGLNLQLQMTAAESYRVCALPQLVGTPGA